MDKKLVLIDGHSILNRAFYGVPDLTNSEGIHTNAVFGFLNIIFKILDEEKPDYLTVAFDVKAPTFRHEMYPEYKGTRKAMPEELREQVPLIKDVLKAMDIRIIEQAGYEADDILGTLAQRAQREGIEVALVSGDRDLLQIASASIKIRIPKTKRTGTEIEDYNEKDVIEKYGVTPLQFIDLKGLMGDPSDNIPGVPGIGEKTASKIIASFQSIENAYANIDEVMPNKARESLKTNYDLAILSKELATIKTDCELNFEFEEATFGHIYNEETFVLLKRLEFKSLLSKFECEVKSNDAIEEQFRMIENLEEAEAIFSKIKKTNKGSQKQSDQEFGFYIGAQLIEVDKEILGLSLAFGPNEVYCIQVGGFLSLDYLLTRYNEIIAQNIFVAVIDLKSQLPFIEAVEESGICDLSVAGYVLNPLKDTYHYDDIARDYLNITVPSYIELFGKMSLVKAREEKEKEFMMYCCYLSYVAYAAYPEMMKKLKEEEMYDLLFDIEMPLIYTLYDMEYRGIRVNKEALKIYGDQLAGRILELEKGIYELVEEVFNINSPKQLGVILFEKLALPFAKKTKTGYSTSADILEKLKCEHPVVVLILEYRQLTKLKSTYADGLANYIKEDQRIHGKFNQTITATGRISSTEPNLQNIPIRMELGRQIRKVFIPEEDYVFVDADYSQIELRVLAHMSADERLIAAYREDQDIHRITASQVFHTPLNEVSSAQRSNAKAVNFGIVYGISSFGLGQDLNISRKEAEGYIKKYFETYPRVKSFLDELVLDGKELGYVSTLFHRKRPVPELVSSNFMQRSFGERIAMNSPIQGSAADIIKIAMIRVNQKLKKLQLRSRLILQIHDELLVETHKEEIDQVRQILLEEMHQAAELMVPLEVDINQGNNWYESK